MDCASPSPLGSPIPRTMRFGGARFPVGENTAIGSRRARRPSAAPFLRRRRAGAITHSTATASGPSQHLNARILSSPCLPQSRLQKIESFFGPGIKAIITPQNEGKEIDVALISDGSAAGGVKEDEEVLPPLMPGLAPRVVKKTK